jgi:hypothetical protein
MCVEPLISKVAVFNFMNALHTLRGHVVAEWLRHCATSQKVTGSRPDEVHELFQFT